MGAERGQAQVEAVAAVAMLLLAAGLALRLAALISSTLVADTAAHAGALAQVSGGDPVASARRALPRRLRGRSRVRARSGRVVVRVPLSDRGRGDRARAAAVAWSRAMR